MSALSLTKSIFKVDLQLISETLLESKCAQSGNASSIDALVPLVDHNQGHVNDFALETLEHSIREGSDVESRPSMGT